MSAIPRVVLAGGRASPELAVQIGGSVRAMALFGGKRLIDLVVEALAAADGGAPVTVVGDLPDSATYARVPDQGDYVSNLLAGVARHAGDEWILITSADMPFLTGKVVARFTENALLAAAARGAAVVYPVVLVSACYARYPGIKRTSVKLLEGEFTGGNMMLARPSFFMDRRDLLARTFAARKNPFRLAWMLGPDTVARLAVSQLISPRALDIPGLEAKVGRLVQGRVATLVSVDPELATDLDKPADFVMADRYAATEIGVRE